MHQAEALAVPICPFEIIHECPMKIAAHIDAIFDSAMQFAQIAADKIDSLRIIHRTIQRHPI
jgi:hypothetical protein